MAVPIESSGQIDEFLGVVKRRLWWIVLPALVATAIGVCFAIVVPKKYVASTRIMVRNTLAGSGAAGGRISNSAQEAQVAPHQVKSTTRITAVLESLRWPEYLDMLVQEKQEYITKLRDNLTVKVPTMPRGSDSQVVEIQFSHPQPDKSADFLTTLQQKWRQEVLERGKTAEAKRFQNLKENKAALEEELQSVSQELTRWRRDFQIAPSGVPLQPGPIPTYDTAFEQLQADQSSLREVKERLDELRDILEDDRERYATMDDQILRTVQEGGVNMDAQIAQLETRRAELLQQIDENGCGRVTPSACAPEDEIDLILGRIRTLEDQETESVERQMWEPNAERIRLGEKIRDQEDEVERSLKRRRSLNESVSELRDRANELQQVFQRIAELEAEEESLRKG